MGVKAIAGFLLLVAGVFAQSQTSEQQNLQTCLSGRYPALCNHSSLSAEQLQQAQAAEIRENLKTCMTGRYPALCNHSLLSSNELAQVRDAERAENLKVCMDGHYPSLCNHSLLTTEEAGNVGVAETRAAASRAIPSAPAGSTERSSDTRQREKCESGLSIESVKGDGKVIKLDDGSMWEVDDVDTVDTALWLVADEVVLCEGKIINTDENESAAVTPITAIRGGVSAGSKMSGATSDDEIALYDGNGFAVAYIAIPQDSTVYTWAGEPVAYLDGENIYGFNGEHLGWFQNGSIYDHQGKIAGTTADAATVPLRPEPFKGFKQFKPFKAFKQFAPLQPILTASWSQLPLTLFLSQGSK